MTAYLAGAAPIASDTPTLADFQHMVWWIIAIKVVCIFLFLLLSTTFMIWAERRLIGRMQNRPGPNRAGPFGLLQSIADALKLPLKEDIVPRTVDKALFFVAPIVSAAPALVTFAIIPFGPVVSIAGVRTPLQLADLPVAVLLVLAMSSIGVYGIVLAGWSSRSPYSLLGGLRSSAQVISYEIAMGLSFVAVFLYAGSLSTSQIVAAQAHGWYIWELIPSFVIYVVTMVGETNRLPFDLPEGEGELVGGYHTEYSSMRFTMFYLAEYVNMTNVSALAVTLFLGGWRAPVPISLWSGANHGWWPILWFLIKVALFEFGFIWLRGSLPRVRYDQLMALGWKILIPVSIVWVLLIATIRVGVRGGGNPTVYAIGGVVLVLIVFLAWAWDAGAQRRINESEAAREEARAAASAAAAPVPTGGPLLAVGGPEPADHAEDSRGPSGRPRKPTVPAREAVGFRVPPMDLPHYHGVGVTGGDGGSGEPRTQPSKEVAGA